MKGQWAITSRNRFLQIVAALTVLPVRSCLIDGEAVVCNASGLAVFDLIRGYRHDAAAVLCAFDLLELDGETCGARRSRSASASWRSFSVTPMRASPSTSTTQATARSSTSTPARSAARASCRSGSARPTAPAALIAGSRSRTRTRQRCVARPRRIGVRDGKPPEALPQPSPAGPCRCATAKFQIRLP